MDDHRGEQKHHHRKRKAPPPSRANAAAADASSVDGQIYTRVYDSFIVRLPPTAVRRGQLEREALRQIGRSLEGKCGRNGYVRARSLRAVSASAPLVAHGGDLEVHVNVQYDACNPLVNTLLRAPLCVCTSNNNAALEGEVRDARGALVATVKLPREGIVADAETNDLAFAPLLASPTELAAVQPGDVFGCLVRDVTFELLDTHVSIQGQLLSQRAAEQAAATTRRGGAERGGADDGARADEDEDDDGRSAVRFWTELQRVLLVNRVDLPALRDALIAQEAERVSGAELTQSAAAASRRPPLTAAAAACAVAAPVLAEYRLANDHTAYITIALQEVPLLATSITKRLFGSGGGGGVQRMPSFLRAWDSEPALRELILNRAALLRRGGGGGGGGSGDDVLLDSMGRVPFDQLVELRWQESRTFRYELATTFMPAYAKAIIAHFRAKRVLDPCAGWGDRLAGALALRQASRGALARTYHCFDPNRALRRGHRAIAALFGAGVSEDDGTSMIFDNGYAAHALPFEEGAPELAKDGAYDLVFTSPPYFDFEVYSADNPQYGSDWLGRFYRPLAVHAARCLAPGGHLCLHIDDTSAGDIRTFLCTEVPVITSLVLRGRITLRGNFSNQARSVWFYQKPGGKSDGAESGSGSESGSESGSGS